MKMGMTTAVTENVRRISQAVFTIMPVPAKATQRSAGMDRDSAMLGKMEDVTKEVLAALCTARTLLLLDI